MHTMAEAQHQFYWMMLHVVELNQDSQTAHTIPVQQTVPTVMMLVHTAK